MKKFIKCLVISLLLVSMLIVPLAGCTQNDPGQAEPNNDNSNVTPEVNADEIDLSEHVDLVMYLLGDPPSDLEPVLAEINKLAEEELNATLTMEYIPWSDMGTRYSLILSSGEKCDLMFTGDWAYYLQEATKGAFTEITMEKLEKYMPNTLEQWTPAAWNHTLIDGKMYGIPNNLSQYTSVAQAVAIRGDLREKYGIEPLETLDDLENYLFTIAENEAALEAFLLAAPDNSHLAKTLTFFAPNDIVQINPGSSTVSFVYEYKEGEEFTSDQLVYNYMMPEYAEWAKRMKTWADKGVWSRNSLSNELHNQEAFENGKTAACVQHFKSLVGSMDKMNVEHPEWKIEVYNLFPDNIKIQALYSGDMMAIPFASENPERAMMLLDKLNTDPRYYYLMQMGLEGVHWIDEGNGMYSEGEKFQDYRAGQNGQWGMQNQLMIKTSVNENPLIAKFTDEYDAMVVHPIAEGFRPNELPVKNEIAAIRAVEERYGPMLDLGLVDDVDATLAEFKAELEKAGLEKVLTEYRKQLDEFLAAVQ